MIPVTVIIPTFNRAAFLRECLASLAVQTLMPARIIVVDDGSDDETSAVCQEAAVEVQYLHQARRGVSAARNLGIDVAATEWLAFLDSDDLWQPDKLERQWEYLLAHPDCRVLQTEEVWIRRGRRVNPRRIHAKPSGWIFEPSLELCLVSPSAVMIHRQVFDAVGRFDESLPACEDYDLWLRIALHFPVTTLREPLTVKRGGHADQLSAQWGLDRYRVQSLRKLLAGDRLDVRQRSRVMHNLLKRCEILIQGFEKRDKLDEAQRYREIAGLYSTT